MVLNLFRREGTVFSPLAPDLYKKRDTYATQQNVKTRRALFTLYVGENFTVQMPFSLNLKPLVNNTAAGGLFTTNFFTRKTMASINLTAGGYRLLSEPNAGGSSVVSEVLSFELLGRCFGARLQKTEMEVPYFPHGGSITDYVCEVSQTTVGVSVTRAWKYQGEYSLQDATHLLNKKLKGVLQSTQNSLVKWTKQILHVWSASESVTSLLHQAYTDLDNEVKANTIVLVTTAFEADYIFTNG